MSLKTRTSKSAVATNMALLSQDLDDAPQTQVRPTSSSLKPARTIFTMRRTPDAHLSPTMDASIIGMDRRNSSTNPEMFLLNYRSLATLKSAAAES